MVEFLVRSSLAGVAQLVEQLIRNQQVTRSSRVAGSNLRSLDLRRRLSTITPATYCWLGGWNETAFQSPKANSRAANW
jgi:hypothetical protein